MCKAQQGCSGGHPDREEVQSSNRWDKASGKDHHQGKWEACLGWCMPESVSWRKSCSESGRESRVRQNNMCKGPEARHSWRRFGDGWSSEGRTGRDEAWGNGWGKIWRGLLTQAKEFELHLVERRGPWKDLKCSDALLMRLREMWITRPRVKAETVQRLQQWSRKMMDKIWIWSNFESLLSH